MVNQRIREFIVSTFGTVCLLIVVIPTVLVLAAALTRGPFFAGIIIAGLVFVVSAFLAGGALRDRLRMG